MPNRNMREIDCKHWNPHKRVIEKPEINTQKYMLNKSLYKLSFKIETVYIENILWEYSWRTRLKIWCIFLRILESYAVLSASLWNWFIYFFNVFFNYKSYRRKFIEKFSRFIAKTTLTSGTIFAAHTYLKFNLWYKPKYPIMY